MQTLTTEQQIMFEDSVLATQALRAGSLLGLEMTLDLWTEDTVAKYCAERNLAGGDRAAILRHLQTIVAAYGQP